MAGYVRQSTYTDGDVITAAQSNNEFNQLLAAFVNTTGHKHDGTAAEGPVIGLIGDPGVATPINKVVVDDTNNRVGVFVDVGGSTTEQIRFQDGVILPVTDNDIDLGASGTEFKDLFIDGTANIDALIADTADINGGTIDGVTIGAASAGAVTTSSLVATTADINAGTVDGVVIGGASAAAITGTTLVANTSINIAGDGATVTGIKDEDDMSSNSAVKLATQQSIKAYVDAQVTAQDLDFQADSGGVLSIDLDSETFTLTGGTGIDTSGSGNAVTFAIDSTVATLTGSQTLTNKTLTAPILSGSSSAAGSILFKEDTDNGTNAVTLIGPASTADVTVTLPAATDTLVGKATTDTLTNKTLTSPTISGGAITSPTITTATLNGAVSGTSIKDEDNMASDSATHLATQQSIKAYVDTEIATIPVGDITQVNAGTGLSGGGGSGTVTLSIDNSVVATLTDSQTLTNKSLTSPAVTGTATFGGTDGVSISQGAISIKNGGTQSYVDFYCESSNAHYARLQAPAHSAFSGNITLTMPATTDTLVARTTTDTLTNKTLTSPVLGGTTTTASGNLILNPATQIVEVRGSGSTEGQIQLNCRANSHGQKIVAQPHSAGVTNEMLLPTGSNSTLVSEIATQTLTNKTLTSPTINGGSLSSAVTGATQSSGTSNTTIATTAFAVTEANNAAVAMAIALG